MRQSVIVTRPAREAPRWIDGLRAAGFDVHALPLIAIAPVDDAVAGAALVRARHDVARCHAAMFVSAAAVEHFFAPVPVAVSPSPAPPHRCWATGPGTVLALRRAGVSEARIDAPSGAAASFDSETLWGLVRAQVATGTRVLIVRGGDAGARPTGRDWLARAIEAAVQAGDLGDAYRLLTQARDLSVGDAPALAAAELELGRVAAAFEGGGGASAGLASRSVSAPPATAATARPA